MSKRIIGVLCENSRPSHGETRVFDAVSARWNERSQGCGGLRQRVLMLDDAAAYAIPIHI